MRNLKIVLLAFLLYQELPSFGQGCSAISARVSPSPTSPPRRDTTVCKGSNLNIFVNIPTVLSTTSYTVSSIPYIDTLPCESAGSLVAGSGINIDDGYSAVQSIGFNFCFYGNTHNQLQICDNGFLTFSVNKPVLGTLTAPFIVQSLPLAANPNPASGATTLPPNSILGAWMDAYLVIGGSNPGGGTITTQLVGTAPFRAYIVKWNNCRYYNTSCRPQTNMFLNMKIVLYETTNLIDVYIRTKPICTLSATSFRYLTTQGLQGDSIFKNIVTPGRNNTIWDGANSAVRFTPNGSANTTTVQWTKNGTVISSTPTASITHSDDSANYVANVSYTQPCPSGTFISRDTLKVYGLNNNISVLNIFDTIPCQESKSYNSTNAGVIGYQWDNGSTNPIRTIAANGRYFVMRRYNTLGCQRDTVFYHIRRFESIKIDSIRRIGCFNSQANGQVRLFLSGDTVGWKLGTTSNPSLSLNPLLNQTRGTFTYWVRNGGNCRDSITLTHDSMSVNYSKRVNFCTQDSSGLMRLTPTGGYAPYNFDLTGRASQAIDSFNKITSGIYTIQVTDRNGCMLQRTDTIKPFTNLNLTITHDSVKCFGDSTGRIIATLNGGKPGYLYSINNGSFISSGIFNLLPVGSYIIKTKDAANCPMDTTISIAQYPMITASISKLNNCPFNSNGSITISASGGNPSYDYRMNAGAFQSTPSFLNLMNGSFSYSIRDRNNCIRTFIDTLKSQSKPILGLAMKKNVSCYGLSDGKIRVSTSSGKSPFTHSWNIGGSSDSLVNLPSASYMAFISDSNGCKDTMSIQITQPDSLRANLIRRHPLCHLSADGFIKVLPIGGILPYQFSLSGSSYSNMDSFSGLAGAVYTIQLRDSQSCTKSYMTTLTNPSALQLSLFADSVKCFGSNDGKIKFLASGGSPGYTYRISSLAYDTFSLKSNLIAANYTVSLKDTNGCVKDSSIQVYSYSPINMVKNILDTIRCKNGNDGRISMTVAGGRSPYTYSINGGLFQSSNIFPNLNTGMKYLRVKDAYNCEILDSIFMTEPSGMTSNVTIQKNVSCYGQSNAKARVNVVGGQPPYSYFWSNGVILDSNSNLNSGTHYVRMTDTKNCKDSVSFFITQPDSLHANLSLYHPRCHNTLGSIKVNATGGTTPYQYSFHSSTFGITDSFINLTGTNYTIVVRDTNLCSKTYTPLLVTPSQLTATYKMDSIRCFGASTGKITITHSGGTGIKTIFSNSVFNSGDTVKNLSVGNYFIEVLDANNCKTDSLVNVPQYSDIVLTIQKDTVKCYGNSSATMTISAAGGSGGYSYGINSSTFGSSNSFTGIPAGVLSAKVCDQYLCQKTQNVTITQVDSMIITPQLTQNLCFKDSLGKVKFLISGGTAPYLISFNGSGWSAVDSFIKLPAGIYSFSVRDFNNCIKNGSVTITHPSPISSIINSDSVKCYKQSTGSILVNPLGGTPSYMISFNGQAFVSSNSFVNLTAGFYNVKIRDANLCIKDTNVEVKSSDTFFYNFIVDSIDCNNANNGRVTINPQGGKSPYQYSLNSGAFNSNNVISNLTPTNHSIQIRDAYNCILTLPISLTNPSPIQIQLDSNIANLCFNESKGRLQVSSSGAKPPYSFAWSNGGSTNRITSLAAGAYTVTVRDAKNCMKSLTTSITQPNDFSITPNQTNLKCFGDADGSISVFVMGATPNYSYIWSTGSANPNLSGLAAGNYSVTVRDAHLCQTTRNYTITQPDSIKFDLLKLNSHCASSKDGAIQVINLSGGVMPPTYSWSHGPASMDVNSLEPFITYTLTITDNNGCQKQKSSYIDTMYILRIKLDTIGIPRCPYSLLNLRMTPITGTSPFEFNLGGNKNTTGDFPNQKNRKYVYTIKDIYNCSFTDSVDLVPRDSMKLSLTLYPPPCESANIFPVKANVTGSKAPYSFDWPRAYQTSYDSARYNLSGFYEVHVRDVYNCLVSSNFTLTLPDGALQGVFSEKKNLRCYQLNDGVLKIEGRGGIPPYKYLWNTGETTEKIQNLKANFNYQVTIFDSDTCRYIMEDTLSQPDSLEIYPRKIDKTCTESTNGSIILSAKKGVPRYYYALDTNLGFQRDSIFNFVNEGLYLATVRDDSFCQTSIPVTVDVKYKLSLTLDSIYFIKAGETVFLNTSLTLLPSSAFYMAEWTPSQGLSCADCLNPEFSGYRTTRFSLNLKYGEGCKADYSILIKVEGTQNDELFVPNAFSPSGEKIENQTFKAYANRVLRFEMAVYNRWGEKVFETDDIRIGWDGTYKGEPAAKGVYTYTLRLTKLDGIRIVKSGEVSLF